MRIDPKDRIKVIVLVVVLLALWVFIGVRFAILSRAHQEKLKAAEAAHRKAHELADAEAAQQTSPTLRLAALVAPVNPPTSDPFHPIIPPRRPGGESEARPTVAPRSSAESPATLPSFPTLPVVEGARSSRDQLTLTGVVLGNPATAVLRVGDEHYVVKEGDYLEGTLRVQKIVGNSVTLRDGRSTYILRLGG